jgi:hypothetical protein
MEMTKLLCYKKITSADQNRQHETIDSDSKKLAIVENKK